MPKTYKERVASGELGANPMTPAAPKKLANPAADYASDRRADESLFKTRGAIRPLSRPVGGRR